MSVQFSMFFFVLYHYPILDFFKGHKIVRGFFGGLIFGPGIFLGFAGSPRDFFGS